MNAQQITLVSYGHFEKEILRIISDKVFAVYGLPVNMEETHFDLSNFYDPNRRQYDGNKLLKNTDDHSIGNIKTIALFNVDIFIPILTYIFGQAYLNGNSGVVSAYRLKNELYGLKPNKFILIERLAKVIIHELGHTFGLKHCYNNDCVMKSTNYVEDIDQKNAVFCSACKEEYSLGIQKKLFMENNGEITSNT